jgi:uncharacterized membrane protein
MSRIEQSIDVDVPVETAYNQWTQFEEFPRFMDGVKRVEQLDDRRSPSRSPTSAWRGGGWQEPATPAS